MEVDYFRPKDRQRLMIAGVLGIGSPMKII